MLICHRNLRGPQKTYFWLGDEAVPKDKLTNYLQHSKAEHAHHTAAWSSQTGKGLLYYAKHEKDKGNPSGIIPLVRSHPDHKKEKTNLCATQADVVEITPLGAAEFTFKVHGHKHSFLAANKQEREGWLKAIHTACEEAKGKLEEIQGSEGYKKMLEELSMSLARHVLRVRRRANVHAEPAAAGASMAGATAAAAATPSKKSDERATREENGTTKSKSRSLSRGKRASIFDRLAGKKEEAKEESKDEAKDETKKDEPAKDAEAPAAETTADGECFPTHTLCTLTLIKPSPGRDHPRRRRCRRAKEGRGEGR